MEPVIDHIQVTVADMARAIPFYDALLPALGFDVSRRHEGRVEAHDLHVVEYAHPRLIFAVSSPRQALCGDEVHRRRPGSLHHLAFRAESREEVDRFHEHLVAIGAEVLHDGPRLFPQHGADYYAVFFKDPDGLKYEVVHESR